MQVFLNSLIFFSVLTSSFDLINLNLGVVKFKLSMIFLLLFIFLYPIFGLNLKKIYLPRHFKWLLVWSFFIISFTPNTSHLLFSVLYTVNLLIYLIAFILFANLNINIDQKKLNFFIKLYIYSFLIVACLGILQFSFGLLGIDFFIAQWWPGNIPRINAFSYEPSYFATYLLIGWSLLEYCKRKRNIIYSTRFDKFALYFLMFTIFLSSSRGIIFIIISYHLVLALYLIFVRQRNITRSLIFFCIFISFVMFLSKESSNIFLSGIGLFSESSHSSGPRLDGLFDTLEVFYGSPFIGYSLGGVWSVLAVKFGGEPGEVTGTNVLFEVLAASGIFGFIFFLIYQYKVFKGIFSKNKFINSFSFAYLFLFFALQFNQNIMRPYLWFHLMFTTFLMAYFNKHKIDLAPEKKVALNDR